MRIQDLEEVKKALEYALNDCPVKDGDNQTHFNTFANALELVDKELNLLTLKRGCKHPMSNRSYSGRNELYCNRCDSYFS